MDAETQCRWERLCARLAAVGYSGLSRPERLWLNVRGLIDSINNGGLISYFYNSGADHLSDCLSDLTALSSGDVQLQVLRVCDLFDGGVPRDIDARNALIESWSDANPSIEALFRSVDNELVLLLPDLEGRLQEYLVRQGLAAA